MKIKNIIFITESGKELVLTEDECKQLYDEISKLYGSKQFPPYDPLKGGYIWTCQT